MQCLFERANVIQLLTSGPRFADDDDVVRAAEVSFELRGRNKPMNSSADQPLGSPITDPDRRSHPRLTVNVQLELREEGRDIPIRTETADLSRGGCYVQLSLTLTLGTHVQGRLWLDGAPVQFRGRVVTTHPQFGNGIMFLEFEGTGEQILASYLEATVV